MIYPSKSEFVRLAKQGNLIPVYKEILADFDTPLSSFLKIQEGRYSYLLESVEGGERLARYSFMGSNPSLVFKSKGKNIEVVESGRMKKWVTALDPLAEIKKIMSGYKLVHVKGLPRFFGGLVGYMGYDMVRFFEEIPDKNPDEINVPDSVFLLTDTLLIFDHVDRKIKIVSNAFVKGGSADAYTRAVRKINRLEAKLKANIGFKRPAAKKKNVFSVRSDTTKEKYCEMVRAAREYIKKGDIIQTVLSQRLSTKISASPFDIYRALRSINPSPYMFYLDLDGLKLVGSSPEILVRTEDGVTEVRPIAGTCPRGKDDSEDHRLIKHLLKDPKEKAEHIMLVDLGRNDIGRVCRFNTVRTKELMRIEKYSHVMHIVSDVRGELRKDKDVYDVIRSSFPAGTVSGAPKIRAMEIIDELENTRRGPYAGGVGYFSFSGNEDFCIAIRTLVVKGRNAYIQVGAGIVKDSVPEREYNETLNKAQALLKAIEAAERGLE